MSGKGAVWDVIVWILYYDLLLLFLVLRIRICRIRMFLGLLDPDPVSLVRGTDLEGHLRKEQDPDPSVRDTDPRIQIRNKMSRIRNTDIMIFFLLFYILFVWLGLLPIHPVCIPTKTSLW